MIWRRKSLRSRAVIWERDGILRSPALARQIVSNLPITRIGKCQGGIAELIPVLANCLFIESLGGGNDIHSLFLIPKRSMLR